MCAFVAVSSCVRDERNVGPKIIVGNSHQKINEIWDNRSRKCSPRDEMNEPLFWEAEIRKLSFLSEMK
jgi:hypothetical protein